MKKMLKQTQEMFEVIIESMDDGIMIEDERGEVMFVNRAMVDLLGYDDKNDICGRAWIHFFSLEQEQPMEQSAGAFQSLLLTKDSRKIPILITSTSFYFKEEYIGVLSVIKDITLQKQTEEMLEKYRGHLEELVQERTANLAKTTERLKQEIVERKKAQERIKYLAHHDNLTQLPNRRLFFDRLQSELLNANESNKYVALLYIDLDGFKAINDTHGHESGDMVLKTMSQRIKECLGLNDMASRFGGDEFTVIIPGLDNSDRAEAVAQKIVRAIESPFAINSNECRISASIGISMYPTHGKKPNILLRHSDLALYEVKNSGKNNYKLYDPAKKSAN